MGLLALMPIFMSVTAHAIIVVTPPHGVLPGQAHVQLKVQDIDVTLSDRAAEVTVALTYYNPTNWTLEGTWLFPLPPEAAVDDFTLYVDGERIRAELLEADAARREYESIVSRMRDPALLEYVDRQLLKARVYPIRPHQDAKVELYYTHPVTADFGTTDFVYPLGSERYHDGSDVSLTVAVKTEKPLLTLNSPTHRITVDRRGARDAVVQAHPRWQKGSDDFHLLCTYDTREVGAQFLAMSDDDGDQFFMAIIAPGEEGMDRVLPKDVVFCFDRSGSMQGDKIVQARAALHFCLNKLNPDDRFGLILFNDGIEHLDRRLRRTTPENLSAAHNFVNRNDADGGTFIAGALQRSMEMFEGNDRPAYVVFLTDGRPTVGPTVDGEIRRIVRDANRRNARLFAFGVGHDLNAALLNDLAGDGRGYATYVAPGEDVEVAVSNFFRKVSRPVLIDCRLETDGDVRLSDMYPRELPDVFAGSEIVLVGRFDGSGPLTARLLGRQGNEPVNHTFETVLEPQCERYSFIPKLWAGRRIGHLLEQMRRSGETDETKDEVIRLSKKYGIMTPYTAYLAAPEAARIVRGGRSEPMVYGAVTPSPNPSPSTVQGPASLSPAPPPGQLQPPIVVHSAPQMIQMDRATTKRDVTAEKIRTAPALADLDEISQQTAGDQRIVTSGGRQFTLRDSIWTDWDLFGADVPADTIVVQRYSDAYFRLTRIKGMAPLISVGERVMFLWRNVVIRIDNDGEKVWNPDWDGLL